MAPVKFMRPPKCRSIGFDPAITVFKPRGVPAGGLITVELQLDELEAIRLADYQKLHHAVAGQKMGVSRATFGRILEQARAKVADALLHGKALQFRGGDVVSAEALAYECLPCNAAFEVPEGTRLPPSCPHCAGDKVAVVRKHSKAPGGATM